MTRSRCVFGTAVLAVLLQCAPTHACAVCFGDPDSAMAKGGVVGVYVMIGVVGVVLAGIVGTAATWMHRGRRLAQAGLIDFPSDS